MNKKIFVVAGAILLGCARGPAQVSGGQGGRGPVKFADPNNPRFQEVFAQVIQPKCATCHSAGGGNKGGINLETHAGVVAGLALVRDAVASGFMPPRSRPPLTPEEQSMFLRWIDQGALNN